MSNMVDNRAAHGPRVLDDVRVLDFTAVIAGPYCTRMLADLGADVLKVEGPEGENMRHLAPLRGDSSTVFAALNAGKRSLCLDLKRAEAIDLIKRLVPRYDVVVENYSPGVMKRLGLDYATLAALNPRLVMCSISGYGQAGPSAGLPAYAPVVQAYSGYEVITQRSQPGLTRPLNMGLPVADTTAALQAFGAITSALYYRQRTGIGQYIDIAMLDSLLGTMARDFQLALVKDDTMRYYGPVETQDGHVITMAFSQPHFEKISAAIGRLDLRQDPRFTTQRGRFEHYNELMGEVEQWTRARSTAHALEVLGEAGLPVAPYRGIGELIDDPQLKYRNMFAQVVDDAGTLTVPNSPFLFSATQAAVRPDVAGLGAHNERVLGEELGLDTAAIATLRANGVFGKPVVDENE